MNQPKILVENVSKTFIQHNSIWGKVAEHLNYSYKKDKSKELCVLKNVNLSIANGERLGIIGRNGAGKSTLLRIIAGLLRPTDGKVRVNGKLTALFDVSTGFHPDFTGRQNALANLGYRGITGKQAEKMVEEIIEFSELYDFIDRPFKTYSAGMQSRLTFSVATTIKPDILIVDEILGAGDAYFASKCMERMKDITSNGATVILVSHSMSAILQFCNRSIWVERGNVIADGRPIDVAEKYQKSVDTYERLRMIAKNAKLQIKISPSVLSGTLGRYLMFKLSEVNPADEILIHRIDLLNRGEEEHQLIVGGPLDTDASYGLFIANEASRNGWDKPSILQQKSCRKLQTKEGADSVFLALFPLETNSQDSYSVQIHTYSKNESKLRLEIMNRDGEYVSLGEMSCQRDAWNILSFNIPENFYRSDVEFESKDTSIENDEEHISDEEEADESAHEEAIRAREEKIELVRQRFLEDEGPVFITSFNMYKDQEKETNFKTNDKFAGEIHYLCTEEIKNPIFVANITRVDGIRMRQTVASLDGLNIGNVKRGEGKVRFIIDPLPFGPGDYVISIGVFRELDLTNTMTMTKPMSLRSNAYEFKVLHPTNILVDMGCVQCPVKWEVF